MPTQRIARLVMVWCLILLPAAAWAQAGGTGAIAGVVKDTSGAVMPGVTVEAASPALIEKVRTVVTDGQGQYKIVDLRPGTYVVTFTLPGFSTVKREGLGLTTAFTATVNADLKVGTLEETVTVSGQAPVVDTQNVGQQATLARSTLDALPNAARTGNYATILPGAVADPVTRDVGGTVGESGAQFAVHGGRAGDIQTNVDGMSQTVANGSSWSWNPHSVQEVVLETTGSSGEASTGGVRVNLVPKDGGNTVTGSFAATYASPSLQSANLTDALRARGLTATPSLRRTYDVGGGLGGPIKRDRLWFFTAHRKWGASQYQAGNFYNKTQGTNLSTDPVWRVVPYTPDVSRPAFTNDYYEDHTLRLTWQAAEKDKIAGSYALQRDCNCPIFLLNPSGGFFPTPEGVGEHYYNPDYIVNVSWSRPATNRLLFEAGTSANMQFLNSKRRPEVGPNDIAIRELSTNQTYGARALNLGLAGSYTVSNYRQFIQRFAVSYITGSHAFKVGLDAHLIFRNRKRWEDLNQINGGRNYSFRNGVPVSVTIWATPFGTLDHTLGVGAYVQDQWTVRKLTLNLGARYDSYKGSIPEHHLPAGLFVPARDFPAVENSPDWKNLSPRLGAAYDLFGTGKTALKASLGRYVVGVAGTGASAQNNPASNQPAGATRTWTDANGNYIPDCVLDASVPGANGECGRLSDLTFGQVTAGNTRFANDVLAGFNDSQAYTWQSSVSVQQELRPGMALNVGYFRTWYGNFTATDNQLVTPANYDPYCITAPVDARLSSTVSGSQVCGLYDITPTLFGKVDNLVTRASRYGTQTEVYNGVDATLNARFGRGGQFSGGLSVGRTVTDTCFVVDSPQQARPGFCHVSPPWSAGTQVKFLVVYPLPWQLQTSATYQNIAGIPITASYVATNAQILPSLGRNLAAGAAGTASIDLIPPGTLYEDRIQQVDLRFTRIFQMGKAKVRGNFDIYNMLNASSILATNTAYGPLWLNARQILGGRLFKFSGQLEF